MLSVRNLHAGYDDTEIVHGVSFDVADGEFCCIIGSNGCGKTTLLKNLLGLIKPWEGTVTMDGDNVLELPEREMARRFAYIPQAHTPPFPYSVRDVVILGRTPYLNRMAIVSPEDRLVAYRSMKQLGIENLADETYTDLSGGQRQLVLIARALTQQPKVLIMDEPTASLDFGNQQLVLSRMKTLSSQGMSVIMVTHDPDHALYCADRVVVMKKGRVIKDGTAEETITTQTLQDIYQTQVQVLDVTLADGKVKRVCVPFD
jgi:iron complex transport system ATP-binding protein